MRRLRTLAVAAAAASILVLAGTLPAAAHDELVSSSPDSGQRLAAAPAVITLTYSAEVLQVGAAVLVVDAEGHDWATGEPAVSDGVVTVALAEGMPDAGYEIRWRVVSSDGHPISGVVPFTVGDGEPLVRAPAAAPDPGEEPTEAPQNASEDQTVLRTVLIGAGGAAIALALLFIIRFSRRRSGAGDSQRPAAPRKEL